jgi:hypothetical protein
VLRFAVLRFAPLREVVLFLRDEDRDVRDFDPPLELLLAIDFLLVGVT